MLQADYGLYTWPSSFVLARHLFRHRERYLQGVSPNSHPISPDNTRRRPARVLELGAGTALPGLLLAKLGARVTLTDAADQPEVLANLEAACRDNGFDVLPPPDRVEEEHRTTEGGAAAATAPSGVSVSGLTWGTIDAPTLRLASVGSFDVVVGADVFYSKGRDFDRLFATVRLLLERSENAAGVFVTAYQHRSAHRSLEALLRLWGLEVRRVWHHSHPGEEEERKREGEGEGHEGHPGVAAVDVVEIVISSQSRSRAGD